MARKGQLVSSYSQGGLWKIMDKVNLYPKFPECARYTLRNCKTKIWLIGIREHDIVTKDNPLFNEFQIKDTQL